MKIQFGQSKLFDLIDQAYKGQLMLPDFQRNFVWSRVDIEELIKSLLEGMFIGTFIILHTNPNDVPFKPIFVQGVEKVNPNAFPAPSMLLLDGQQRLTALFYAIYTPNMPLRYTETPYEFFIDLNKLAENNVEEAVFSWSIKSREYRNYFDIREKPDYKRMINNRLLPLRLFKSLNDYLRFRYKVMERVISEEELNKIDHYIKSMLDYHVITLSLDVSYNKNPEKVAILFERINKTGVKLSVYDLLNARFYKYLKLREEWEKVFESNPNIKKYARRVDNTDVPYSFIQALSLASGKSIKSSDLIKIDNSVLNKENWNKVIDVLENKVLPTLYQISNFGIVDINTWLPYKPLVTLFAAFHLRNGYVDIEKIKVWYWSAVFSERYSGSTETKMMRDFIQVLNWFSDENRIPEIVSDFYIQLSKGTFSLKNVTTKSSSKYKGVFNLIFKNNALDFYYPEELAFNSLEDHHIFPKAFLKDKNVDVNPDVVLNRTLLFNKTNRIISNKAPAKYIKEMITAYTKKGMDYYKAEEKIKGILKAHFINEEMYEILKNTTDDLPAEKIKENFERFIQIREEKIKNEITKLVSYNKYSKHINVLKPVSKRELRIEFWKKLLEKCNEKFDLFSSISPNSGTWIEKQVAKGIKLLFRISDNSGSVELYIYNGPDSKELNKKLFDYLYKNKEAIESEIGTKFNWLRLNDYRASKIEKKFDGGLLNIDKYDALQNQMIDLIYKLYNTISKYIPELMKIANQG